MYERAITTILKANMLNHFAYADFEEVSGSSTAFYQVLHLVDALVMFLNALVMFLNFQCLIVLV